MGDSELLTMFHEFCETYKVDCAFEGVFESWDTIGIGDFELRTRGFFVASEKGKKYVGLDSKIRFPMAKPPIAIGDTVLVVGREVKHTTGFFYYNENKANCVDLAVLLMPRDHSIWFSFDKRPISRKKLLFWIFLFIASFGIVIGSSWLDLLRQWWISLLCVLSPFLVYIGILSEILFLQPRQYLCDEETWQVLLEEVESKFGITLIAGT